MRYVIVSIYFVTCCIFGFWVYGLQNEIYYMQIEHQIVEDQEINSDMDSLINLAEIESDIIDFNRILGNQGEKILYLDQKLDSLYRAMMYLHSGKDEDLVKFIRSNDKADELLQKINYKRGKNV